MRAITVVGLTIGLGLAMLLGWGLRVAIYQISRSRHRDSRDRVDRGVNHSGSTGC